MQLLVFYLLQSLIKAVLGVQIIHCHANLLQQIRADKIAVMGDQKAAEFVTASLRPIIKAYQGIPFSILISVPVLL